MTPLSLSEQLKLPLSNEDLDTINGHLKLLTPEEILRWAVDHIPALYQTTAFGLTGLVAIDMLSKITTSPPPLIFLDTLYHFPETYELVELVKTHYGRSVIVYKPEGCTTAEEFERKHGERFWERDERGYDYAVKVGKEIVHVPMSPGIKKGLLSIYQVETARRAYSELGVKAVITGRRASQGGARASLQPLEVDETGLLKVNPLFAWTFDFVDWYVKSNKVPHNKLLEQGYRSVGDWHSTAKSGEGEAGERAGRWAGREEKTECGLHEDYFKLKAEAAAGEAAGKVGAMA